MSSPVSYLVTLRTIAGDSSLGRRLIALHPGDNIVLGRISKNSKTDFTAKTTNGYYDNPIISRRHALLENRGGIIYIIDQSSTHGTFFNGIKLAPYLKRRVESGDRITLGCTLEPTGRTAGHLPTELEVSIVEMPSAPETLVRTDDKISSTNSFHAPAEESDDELPSPLGHTHPVWKPFVPVTLPSYRADFPTLTSIPVQTYIREVSEETAKKPVNTTLVDLTNEENPWVSDGMHVDHIEIESDGDVDDVDEYPDYYPYDYDTEDKESVNGETHAEPIQVYVPPTMETKETELDKAKPDSHGMSEAYIQAEAPMFLNRNHVDTWDIVKQYLDDEKTVEKTVDKTILTPQESGFTMFVPSFPRVNDSINVAQIINVENSRDDNSLSERSDVSESDGSYHWSQDSEEESDQESDWDQEETEQDLAQQVVAETRLDTVGETRFEQTVAETQLDQTVTKTQLDQPIAETQLDQLIAQTQYDHPVTQPTTPSPIPTSPILQSQTPPITPETNPRKRPHDAIQPPDLIHPSENTSLDTNLTTLLSEKQALQNELERVKRQRTTKGWTSTAKSIGKYTVAGVVGGITAVVGLVWSAS